MLERIKYKNIRVKKYNVVCYTWNEDKHGFDKTEKMFDSYNEALVWSRMFNNTRVRIVWADRKVRKF